MTQEIWFQKYRIIKSLGSGGKSQVYLAEHILLNSYRVIKFIPKDHPLYRIWQKEAYILKSLSHRCIPIVYDIEKNEYGSYIVEQYLEGVTLKDFVATKGKLREDIIIQFSLQICDLIHYLHSIERPILYLDLKPDNILISNNTVKLIDFNSAVYQDELDKQKAFYSSRGYAAPELYQKSKVDERSDVYGIGMLLYYMVTGKYFNTDIIGIDNIDNYKNCSKPLKKIINRCLKVNPSQRYASVSHLSKELSSIGKEAIKPFESSQPIRYAVAGAQARIGTTHLCFRLATYFIRHGIKVLYQERNASNCVRKIRDRYGYIKHNGGILQIESILMVPGESNKEEVEGQYEILIQDFGCLTEDNLPQFLDSDVKLLVLGAKDWELAYAEQILRMVTEYKEIIYLFNYLDGRQFQQVMNSMEHRFCYRIPYEPNPFSRSFNRNSQGLFRELASLSHLGREGPYDKKAHAFSKIKRRQ